MGVGGQEGMYVGMEGTRLGMGEDRRAHIWGTGGDTSGDRGDTFRGHVGIEGIYLGMEGAERDRFGESRGPIW